MKKIDLVKLAMLGLSASVCISGQVAHQGNRELAMAKCSKSATPTSDDDMDQNETYDDQSNDQSDANTSRTEREKRTRTPEVKWKSAARKVIEGVGPSNSTMNIQRKSAAQLAMESEYE